MKKISIVYIDGYRHADSSEHTYDITDKLSNEVNLSTTISVFPYFGYIEDCVSSIKAYIVLDDSSGARRVLLNIRDSSASNKFVTVVAVCVYE